MPSWKTLDQDTMTSWKEKLDAINKASPEAQQQLVGQYYQYLIDNNHTYGNLAYQASQNEKFAGRLANNYLNTMAKKENVTITQALRQRLMVRLALRDVQARNGNHGDAIAPTIIHEYHIDTFNKVAGLSRRAWTGTIFEHIGAGTFLLGQGPTDQNGGQFSVEKVRHFLTQAAETGSQVHHDTAHFLGAILTDGVVFETIKTLPAGEMKTFMGNVWHGLEGNKFGLLTCTEAYTVGAQQFIRHNYNALFTASENDSVNPFEHLETPSFFELLADPSAADKQLFQVAKNQPHVKLHFVNAYNQLISKVVGGVDIPKEAHIEYERVYHQPMPESYQQFIHKNLRVSTPVQTPASESRGFFGTLFSWFSSDPTTSEKTAASRTAMPSFDTVNTNFREVTQPQGLLNHSAPHSSTTFFSPSGSTPFTPSHRSDPVGEAFINSVFDRPMPTAMERVVAPLFASYQEPLRMTLDSDRNNTFGWR